MRLALRHILLLAVFADMMAQPVLLYTLGMRSART